MLDDQKGPGGRRCVQADRWGAKSIRGLDGAAPPSLRRRSLMPAAILAMTAALGADDREGLGPAGRAVTPGDAAGGGGAKERRRRSHRRRSDCDALRCYAALWRESRRRSRRRWGSPGRRRTAPPQPPEPAWRGRRRAGGAAAAWSLWRSYGRSEYCDRTQPSPFSLYFWVGEYDKMIFIWIIFYAF
ncbi:unnamed protein product [Spirodela intermedia]|uniref:Uncharacterized protein n=1 Tax=Spirodela intermedia TaxID=51605 RepID=A0A7I8JDY5_SPIIN|nr:unnamed protein product [Spirodela intermedia]CAA6668356.1 unnamed protein product [Spirodela intermedia]